MIVNCFQVFRAIKCTAGNGNILDFKAATRIADSIRDTFELGFEATQVVFETLFDGNSDFNLDKRYDPLTMAETRLVLSIVRWLNVAIGDDYEDGWGQKTRATSVFVFENHNRAVGVMLTRSVKR
jgi:hypothetical protein